MDKEKLIEKYDNLLPLKLLIQNIPYVGTSLDTILSNVGNKWREKRLQIFIQSLDEKIRNIEIIDQELVSEMQNKVNSEDFYNLFIQAGQKSTMTHKKEKIECFANLLKNYLVKDTSFNDYLIEVFLNITENLSEIEIIELSELQDNSLEIYYSYQDKPFDIKRMQNDISKRKLDINYNSIPKEYEYDNFYTFCYNQLRKLDLVNIEETEKYGGSIPIGWSTSYQSVSSQLQYKRKDIITISEFGKKYIEWIKN